MKHVRAFFVMGIAGLLSGCFVSDKPLIEEKDSVTPIKPGTYYNARNKEHDKPIVVTVSGHQTTLALDDSQRAGDYFIRPLRDNLYIMMNRKSLMYALIEIDSDWIFEYNEEPNCAWLSSPSNANDAKLGIVRRTTEKNERSSRCVFAEYGKLASAFGLLLSKGLGADEEGTTYVPAR